ncbi:MAG: PQQ-dependent sugar dehydrogenase [Actinomycetota bacterium]|nr:PQQ-dependent sugar dehydrogenase [Actinomycetota bacterium]
MRGTRLAGMLAAAAGAVAIAAGCGDDSDSPEAQAEAPATAAGETTTAEPTTAEAGGTPRLEKLGDFNQPVFVAQAPGSDDLYVVEKEGRVQRLAADGAVSAALDISGEVSSEGEQGLLSIAFDPDAASRLLYAYFTDAEGDQRVVEFALADDGSIDPASRREVLKMDDFASNHNGGLLLFGPDGLLYIGTGDGGIADDPERNGQDLGSLLGKILRIDPHEADGRPYTPEGAPELVERGAAPEVYAYGLRNPWRYSFDRENAALVIGDVGQNSLEEIDYVAAEQGAGANFGWSAFEGDERFNEDQEAPDHVPPVLTYGRERGCSVTGGYVVRDPGLPALQGRYLYGDFCEGELRSFEPAGGEASDDRPTGLEVAALSSFAEDAQGRIYATSLDGPVFRLMQ